jgi:uroporphyrinogen decarboxylase
MNNRDLVIDTLHHVERDTVPYQLDLSGDMRQKVSDELGEEFFGTIDNCLALENNEEFVQLNAHRKQDAFGVIWLMDQVGDFGVVDNCLIPEPDVNLYRFPSPNEKLIRRKCECLVEAKQRGKFAMYTIGFSLYERAWSLRGIENLLMDMVAEPTFVSALFDRIVEYNLAVVDIASEYPIDGIFFGDDWGQQKGLIMGPTYWRRFIRPALKKMYDSIKSKGLYLCQHSCGDIHEVFGDLIDMGLDIYNTFQPEIYDVQAIKREYGKDLTFYGGVSTQHVLPFGTPDEVKEQTRNMLEIMKPNGGYIAAPTHAMPNDIPVENMLAFLDVVRNQ